MLKTMPMMVQVNNREAPRKQKGMDRAKIFIKFILQNSLKNLIIKGTQPQVAQKQMQVGVLFVKDLIYIWYQI
ncbi:MAG: hypothetical protein BWY74_03578 [Firmicutes bacterium ADurb.Bin419]|nr:MAG: hypothetical protein BWY74_03578 [Firmicutes bacterium ADurb.Bin419]